MEVTSESIQQAHAMEIHPSNGPLIKWTGDDLLISYDRPRDTFDDNAAMCVRITYCQENDRDFPDCDSDYSFTTYCNDATVRDAQSISKHHDVLATAIYAADLFGNHASHPVVFFVDGESHGI